jgi:hypothetical protein
MGIRFASHSDPNNKSGMRLEWWEDDFCLLGLDLDEPLPREHWQHAEKILLHYFGDWIFDPKSRFHEGDARLAARVHEDLRIMREKQYGGSFRSRAKP